MTSPRRFEQDLPAQLGDLFLAGTPDYRDDLVRRTARTRQRPAWTFPERWLPVKITTAQVPVARPPWRALGILALVGILIVGALAVYVGSQPRLPNPFGPAANGAIAYAVDGDIFVRDTLADAPRLVIGGATDDHDPWFAPDGRHLLFVRTDDGQDYLWAADADGNHQALLRTDPIDDQVGGFGAWSPDSRSIAWADPIDRKATLRLLPIDGSAPTSIELGGVIPTDVAWRPPDGGDLLVRGQRDYVDDTHFLRTAVDFYLVDTFASGPLTLRPLGAPAHDVFGAEFDDSGPVWSTDGSTIFYNAVEPTSQPGGGTFRVHAIGADGADDHPLPGPADEVIQEGWPRVSPDGQWIVVHRWTWKSSPDGGQGWLAVMPSDGSRPARDIGPRIPGGEDTRLIMAWSPDGTRVLLRSDNTEELFAIDPLTGSYDKLPFTAHALPDWQRRAP
jgi:WD40-like Beta Propeller Repeat